MSQKIELVPHLIVKDAARAIEFYTRALGARELDRYTDPALGGRIVHTELVIGDAHFSLAEESPEYDNLGPAARGGSPVILHLTVADADATGAAMEKHGARVIFPIADQFYGRHEGRLADPFGHVWIISHPLPSLSKEEIQGRIDRAEF